MDLVQQLGTAMGLGLLSGIRLYITVLAIGIAVRFQWLHLSDNFPGLAVLGDWRVLTAAFAACVVEFVADKIPWLDSAWDSVHTFIRPIGAVLLGAGAFATLDPAHKAILMILCGSVALTGHSAKSATRLAVNHSPEPFSNILLSLAGDAVTPLAVWFTFKYPGLTILLVSTFTLIAAWLSPKIFRAMRVELACIGGLFSRWFGEAEPLSSPAVIPFQNAPGKIAEHMRPLPMEYREALRKRNPEWAVESGIHCSAYQSIEGLGSSLGYLVFTPGGSIVFAGRRWFRYRYFEAPVLKVSRVEWHGHLLSDVLSFQFAGKQREFEVFRTPVPVIEATPHRATA